MINNGKKAIVEPSDYYAYLLEAVRFWTIRLDLLVKKDMIIKKQSSHERLLSSFTRTVRFNY